MDAGDVPDNRAVRDAVATIVRALGGLTLTERTRALQIAAGRLGADDPAQPIADGDGIDELSPREREVFRLIVRGLKNAAIGRALCISEKTVETHRTRIMKKLGVHSAADLVRFAALRRLL